MIGGKLRFTGPDGEVHEEEIAAETAPVPHPLHRQLKVCHIRFGTDHPADRMMVMTDDKSGYELIDNEILAGLQLYRLAGRDNYPPQVTRLVGYSADVPDPFVLLEPHRGIPLSEVAGKLLTGDQDRFQVSLLTGLRWLSLAGVAHRNINPHTIRWDDDYQSVQIADFTYATIFGAPRQITGTPPWAAPEQRPNRTSGDVGDKDDIWAAGRLIFYVITGDEPTDRDSIEAEPELAEFLSGVFGPPEERPTCQELLVNRLGIRDQAPGKRPEDPLLALGRKEFWTLYTKRHLEIPDSGTLRVQASAVKISRYQVGALAVGAAGIIGVLLAVIFILVR